MRILLLGGGGREHALACGIIKSSRLDMLFVSPGNGGLSSLDQKCEIVSLDPCDAESVCNFVSQNGVNLLVVGPEAPLAAGVSDAVKALDVAVFGPTQEAAQLETSKAEAKAFMQRWRLPTAESRTFTDYDEARQFMRNAPWPIVLKASGLAGGKGVILPTTAEQAETALREMMLDAKFGNAGETVIIEERMSGPEISLLCFSDGERIAVMPTARDHKRLLDGDLGPNTGGMGAYAPVPEVTQENVEEWTEMILRPAIAGMQAQGTPYVGILYAGLMLTARGPRILEFNCRFGDPEAQVLLPLLESDLTTVMLDCALGQLNPETVVWKQNSAATVVLASAGYPGRHVKGQPITGISEVGLRPHTYVFQAGTASENGQLVTNGGRVLCVTGIGQDLSDALTVAYDGLAGIQFDGAQFREDIGRSSRIQRRKR